MEENKETEERKRSKKKEGGTIRYSRKETYIAACAVRTLAEEFGRRLRSPLKGETKGPVGEWNNRAAKLMAPLVPHFSISPAASLPPTPPFPPRFHLPPAVIPFAATPSVESYLPKQQRANNYR